jgi:hypothetical protein
MTGSLGRRSLALFLALWLTLLPGCITAALWEGHGGGTRRVAAVDVRGDVSYVEVDEESGWSTAGRVLLTPVTIAADIVTLLFIVWLIDKLGHHHGHRHH